MGMEGYLPLVGKLPPPPAEADPEGPDRFVPSDLEQTPGSDHAEDGMLDGESAARTAEDD